MLYEIRDKMGGGLKEKTFQVAWKVLNQATERVMGFEPTKYHLGKVVPYHLATPALFRDYSFLIYVCQANRAFGIIYSILIPKRVLHLLVWYNFLDILEYKI